MRHHARYLLLLLTSQAPGLACDEGPKPPADVLAAPDFSPVAGFLDVTVLDAPDDLRPLKASELTEIINNQAAFRSDTAMQILADEEVEANETPAQKCTREKNATASLQSGKSWLIASADYDLRECSKLDPDSSPKSQYRQQWYVAMLRNDCDLTEFNGAPMTIWQSVEKKCPKFGSAWRYVNMSLAITYSAGGSSFFSKTAQMTAAGKPCKVTNSEAGISLGPCLHVDFTTGGQGSTLQKLKGVDLKTEDNAEYFSSGVYEFTINDWQGTMVYSGPLTLPTWTASNGSESASGTYGLR